VLPQSLETIQYRAFNRCSALTEISFAPNGNLTLIGISAFGDCNALTTLQLPEGLIEIDMFAFDHCRGLVTLSLPSTLQAIGMSAFSGCSYSLESITVAQGNPTYMAKDNCLIETQSKTLILGCKTSVIPQGVEHIGSSAFAYCVGLQSIDIPEGVLTIEYGAFEGCEALRTVNLSDSVQSIGNSAFAYCYLLANINFSENSNLQTIHDWAFSSCYRLWSYGGIIVKLPDSLTTIGESAFRDVTGCYGFVIGNNVETIGMFAFGNAYHMTIYCTAAEQPTGWDPMWNGGNNPVIWGYEAE
jgi:hypothetical protein